MNKLANVTTWCDFIGRQLDAAREELTSEHDVDQLLAATAAVARSAAAMARVCKLTLDLRAEVTHQLPETPGARSQRPTTQ